MAGPGQRPANAHPMPNKTDPTSNLKSIFLFDGIEKFKSSNGTFLAVIAHAAVIGIIAPPITKANVGSHWPNISSQPCTFAVSVIPEIKRPPPKSKPDIKDTNNLLILIPKKSSELPLSGLLHKYRQQLRAGPLTTNAICRRPHGQKYNH